LTVIAGINAGKFAIIAGDSRITITNEDGSKTYKDCCQKVFRISEATIIGFCGDIRIIADVLYRFQKMNQSNPQYMNIERLRSELQFHLLVFSKDFYERNKQFFNLGVMVAGRTNNGSFKVFLSKSPDFKVDEIETGHFVAMGSGAPNFYRIVGDIERILSYTLDGDDDLPVGAAPWITVSNLGTYLERYLLKVPDPSVSTILHAVCIDEKSVTPIPYESRRLMKANDGLFKTSIIGGTRLEKGSCWIQYYGEGNEIKLKFPVDLLADSGF
jgi:hypothetical protein